VSFRAELNEASKYVIPNECEESAFSLPKTQDLKPSTCSRDYSLPPPKHTPLRHYITSGRSPGSSLRKPISQATVVPSGPVARYTLLAETIISL